jgi:diphosphomevalonate decarboxylase
MSEPTNRLEMKVQWRCPSNIALIKYWGKHGVQLPMNPSLSFVLSNSFTETSVEIQPSGIRTVSLIFEGKETDFVSRIENYLNLLSKDFDWINRYNFFIRSGNSFPHSAGIASSASSFGALALCLTELDFRLSEKEIKTPDFWQKASELARLGSGSACRSVYPGFAVWGKTEAFPNSSDEFGSSLNESIHANFKQLHDAILMVDAGVKEVSSSLGHQLMKNHIYKSARILQANQNLATLLKAIQIGDVETFIDVVENEALSLHALMMSSNPSYILLKPNSLILIERIRKFRKETNIPICFTIDAGPNIHLLYFGNDQAVVKSFIEKDLSPLCVNGQWIDDGIGAGPHQSGNDLL